MFREAGGLGLVNSANPQLFKSMTAAQADAAKAFLSRDIAKSKDSDSTRYFNLDAAKLLYVPAYLMIDVLLPRRDLHGDTSLFSKNYRLQFAAIVYEHPNESVRDAVAVTEKAEEAKGITSKIDLFRFAPTTNKTVSCPSLLYPLL